MAADAPYVIIGASLGGAKGAEALRAAGFDGPITLIGDESSRPYERPPLSKGYLLGTSEREAIYVHPLQWYADSGIDLRLGVEVTGIDPAAHEVTVADGDPIGYARLLITTGSSPRRLEVAGTDHQAGVRASVEGCGHRSRLDRAGDDGGRPRRWGGRDRSRDGRTAAGAGAGSRSRAGLRGPAHRARRGPAIRRSGGRDHRPRRKGHRCSAG
jgi:hypothetical protein